MDLTERHERAKHHVEHSDWVDRVARLGVVTYGLVHLVVAWLLLRLAFGDSAGAPSGSGAFRELAQAPLGRFLLYGVAIGFFALVAWQAVEAAFGFRREPRTSRVLLRVLAGIKALLFGAIGVNAFMVAAGSSAGGSGTDGPTARLMSLPAGPAIVGATGVVIVAVAVGMAWFGLAGKFRENLSDEGEAGSSGRSYVVLGTVGYVSKGVAVALVGALFGYAALTHDPDKSGGLDQAVREVLEKPYGNPAVVVIAVGIACFGVFCFALARHLDRQA
jgi:hypothetical protein